MSRLIVACDACHNKKIKCSGTIPCSNCLAHGTECLLEREFKRRGPRTNEYMASLENRLEKIEAKLDSNPPQPLFSNLAAVQWDLVESYFEHIYPLFPLLGKNWFISTINYQSPFLLSCMHCLGAFKQLPCGNSDSANYYYKEASQMIDSLLDSPCLFNIHGLVLLALYSIYTSNKSKVSVYALIAIRMGQLLNLTRDSKLILKDLGETPQRIQLEYKRRVSWSLYIIRNYLSALEHEIYIDNGEMRVPFPTCETIWKADEGCLNNCEFHCDLDLEMALLKCNAGFPKNGVTLKSSFSCWIILSRIFLRVCNHVRNANHVGQHEPVSSQFAAISRTLDTFPELLPNFMKLNATFSFSAGEIDNLKSPHWIVPYHWMQYHSLMIKLHQTQTSFKSSAENTRQSLVSFSKCEESAAIITHYAEIFLKENPSFSFVGPLVCTAINDAASIWSKISQYENMKSSVHITSKLDILFQCLQNINQSLNTQAFKSWGAVVDPLIFEKVHSSSNPLGQKETEPANSTVEFMAKSPRQKANDDRIYDPLFDYFLNV